MQQLSGSSGFGGTNTPAMTVLFSRSFASFSARSAGPARDDPNITLALSSALDWVGGGVGMGGDVPIYYGRKSGEPWWRQC